MRRIASGFASAKNSLLMITRGSGACWTSCRRRSQREIGGTSPPMNIDDRPVIACAALAELRARPAWRTPWAS